jgi:hypothetical protein
MDFTYPLYTRNKKTTIIVNLISDILYAKPKTGTEVASQLTVGPSHTTKGALLVNGSD